MATVHLIHGFVGSGKTTFSKKLETAISAFRISHDEWMVQLYGVAPPKDKFDEYYTKVDDLIWDITHKLLDIGIDVILDYGFWTRKVRDAIRKRIKEAGHDYKLYALRCDEEEMKERVLRRTKELPEGTFWINESAIQAFKNRFEPLEVEEEHEEIRTD